MQKRDLDETFIRRGAGLSEAITDILTYHNYTVDADYNGMDAREYAKSETYDGIILDIMMPQMSGLEVTQELRKAGCKMPIFLLTAKSEIEDRIASLDMGADDYLPKPSRERFRSASLI